MNTFEINKIVGAVLITVLTVTIISFIGDILVPEGGENASQAGHEAAAPAHDTAEKPAKHEAAKPEVAEPAPAAAPPPAATEQKTAEQQTAAPTIAARLAQANVEAGAKVAKKCLGCHSVAKSVPNKVGPGLWGVVGRAKGSVAGYRYSAGMKAKGGDWSYADLDAFLANPKALVAKTKMTFKVKKPKDRAAVILYLRSLAETPAPLPGQ